MLRTFEWVRLPEDIRKQFSHIYYRVVRMEGSGKLLQRFAKKIMKPFYHRSHLSAIISRRFMLLLFGKPDCEVFVSASISARKVDLLDPASTGIFDLVDGKNKFR
jgi:hypothetical protein